MSLFGDFLKKQKGKKGKAKGKNPVSVTTSEDTSKTGTGPTKQSAWNDFKKNAKADAKETDGSASDRKKKRRTASKERMKEFRKRRKGRRSSSKRVKDIKKRLKRILKKRGEKKPKKDTKPAGKIFKKKFTIPKDGVIMNAKRRGK
jgi:hypothetical protein